MDRYTLVLTIRDKNQKGQSNFLTGARFTLLFDSGKRKVYSLLLTIG